MRIAFLSTFYPFRGGIAQFNASLYREMEKEHEVKAFTFTRQYPDFLFPGKTQYVSNDETADAIPSEQVLDSINPFSYLTAARQIKAFNPDLLVMKYWMSFFGPSLGTVAKLMPAHTKVVTILDNVIPHEKRFFDSAFTGYFLRQNDAFVAMSDSVKNDLLSLSPNARVLKKEHPLYDHFGKKLSREDARRQLKLSPDKKTLLFFGFIRDYKGLDVLIEAFDLLDDSYQLVIAGETYGSFDKYTEMIGKAKHKENIHVFNDYITDSQVPVFFSAADVCVLPYKSATQSGITSIAYHFETPLIATDVGGLKESIHHEKTGLIVDACEPEAIAASIRNYFGNILSESFVPAIQQMKEELSWKNFAAALLDFV
ncbi:MAG: glycosyltransferase [Bacteroidota bacterium]|nr:glycosyltransferase [Bacteroidota bacterium]